MRDCPPAAPSESAPPGAGALGQVVLGSMAHFQVPPGRLGHGSMIEGGGGQVASGPPPRAAPRGRLGARARAAASLAGRGRRPQRPRRPRRRGVRDFGRGALQASSLVESTEVDAPAAAPISRWVLGSF